MPEKRYRSMRGIKYFQWVGSDDGAVILNNRWVRVNGLNRINKTNWDRWQGVPSPYLKRVLGSQPPYEAVDLFPDLVVHPVTKPPERGV